MDSAVAFVQAYLYANGYFTVTEYPVVEAIRHGNFRTATDVDILAVRFPGAGRLVPRTGRHSEHAVTIAQPDAALNPSPDQVDLIVAEVKEGRAELNHGARNPDVLRAALTRFGASSPEHADMLVDELVRCGKAHAPSGPQIRLVAFGSHYDEAQKYPYQIARTHRFCRRSLASNLQGPSRYRSRRYRGRFVLAMLIKEMIGQAARTEDTDQRTASINHLIADYLVAMRLN